MIVEWAPTWIANARFDGKALPGKHQIILVALLITALCALVKVLEKIDALRFCFFRTRIHKGRPHRGLDWGQCSQVGFALETHD